MPTDPDTHFQSLLRAVLDGRVVPFLGGGASLCDRPSGSSWCAEKSDTPPSGYELAEHLAARNAYPESEPLDLARVSQYIAATLGTGPLYEDLHDVFDVDYQPSSLHHLLASVPSIFREQEREPKYQLLITTNFDDLLEQAFDAAKEPYDLVTYVAEGEHRGKFLHRPHEGKEILIARPNEYADVSLDKQSVILKIHGEIRRDITGQDSYVITEDHYIDYLTRTDISNLIPVTLAARLQRSHFLFLGYSLKDWNLRVILHRIWGTQKLSYKSWAVQLDPSDLDIGYWHQRGVDILNMPLDAFICDLDLRLAALSKKSG